MFIDNTVRNMLLENAHYHSAYAHRELLYIGRRNRSRWNPDIFFIYIYPSKQKYYVKRLMRYCERYFQVNEYYSDVKIITCFKKSYCNAQQSSSRKLKSCIIFNCEPEALILIIQQHHYSLIIAVFQSYKGLKFKVYHIYAKKDTKSSKALLLSALFVALYSRCIAGNRKMS